MEPPGQAVTCSGTLTSAGPKFGFIQSPEASLVCNEDVWVGGDGMQGIKVGDAVEFELVFSDKGKPQATNVRLTGSAPPQPQQKGAFSKGGVAGKGAAGKFGGGGGCKGGAGSDFQAVGQKFGTITTIGPKFGFIDCPPVKAQHGVDVFCHISQLSGFNVGDVVDFDFGFNEKGQPQAANLRPRGGAGKGGKAGGGKSMPVFTGWGDGGAASAMGCGKAGLGAGKGGGGMQPQAKGNGGGALQTLEVIGDGFGEAISFTGVISAAGPKFGFIQCPEVQEQYGCDVFCSGPLLAGFSVGEAVDFELALSDQGKPQACNVRRQGMPKARAPAATMVPGGGKQMQGGVGKGGCKGVAGGKMAGGAAGNRYFGTISAIGDKYGFIHCPPIKQQTGADVFVPSGFLVGLSVGDSVEFDLGYNDRGQPQAANISTITASKGGAKGCKGGCKGGDMGGKGFKGKLAGGAVPTGETFQGSIVAIGPKFGFVACPQVKAQYGVDTFAPGAQLVGMNVGDFVEFELQVTPEGKPQARDLRAAGSAPPAFGAGFGGGGPAGGLKRKLDQTEWLV